MLPTAILKALAPVVVDVIKGKAEESGPVGKAVAGMLTDTAKHEKRKASVRPIVMAANGATLVMIAVAGIVAALSPLFGVEQETSDAMCWNLTILFGAVGGAYGVQHGARSVEKMKGAA